MEEDDMEAGDNNQDARAAHMKIEAHEQLCAERYRNISDKINWMLMGTGSIVVGLMAWMAVQLYALEPLRDATIYGRPTTPYMAAVPHP